MDRVKRSSTALIVTVLTASMFSRFAMSGITSALLVDLSREFNTTVAAVGQLVAISAIVWGVTAPAMGPFSDRLGSKYMVVIGQVIYGVSALGYSIGWDFWVLIAFSFVAGLGGAISGPHTLTSVADCFPPATRGRMMSLVNVGQPLAMLLGVPAGALAAGIMGWRWSFILIGAFFLLDALAAALVLPPRKPRQAEAKVAYLSSFGEAFHQKVFLPILIANFLSQIAYWIIATYIAAFLIQTYSVSVKDLAPFLSLIAIGLLLGTLAGGPMADRLSRSKICAWAQLLSALSGVVLMSLTRDFGLSVFLGALFMGLSSSSRAAFMSLMVSISSKVRGTVMGIQATSNHAGRGLGAMVGGLVLGLTGYSQLGTVCLALSIVSAAGFFYVAALLRRMPEGAADGLS